MKRWTSTIWLGACMLATISTGLVADEPPRPNIIIIMSDDMGYSDIGCYGSEINTPSLDALAADGLRFTQFYNTGRCCPTRASLLTGQYPHRAGVGHMMEDLGLDGYRGELSRNCVTIAEVLRDAGYATYMVGKWHVTKHVNPQDESEKFNWPQQRGFDHSYALINGACSMWDPNSLTRDNQLISCRNDPHYQPQEPYHITDAFSDNAVTYIREHDSDKPFFMYVAYTAAHWPMHARPRDIAKYHGMYDGGYEPIRQARLEKMKRLGVIAADTEITNRAGDWESVPDKQWEAACMEVYAAMIDQMDQGIGRIVAALRETGRIDNTLIFFLQDNGGCAEGGGRSPDPAKAAPHGDHPILPTIPDDQIHYFTSVPTQTRDGWPVRRGHVFPGPADTFIGYGKNWANVSNTPLREYKHWVHEGGISTPLIVHWPSGIEAKNELRNQPSHLIDLMATCVDVAGAKYPAVYHGNDIQPMEGVSLMPAFRNLPLHRGALFWEHEGNRAVRVGDWKAVAKGQAKDRELPVRWELYNIVKDRNEERDLAAKRPELLATLTRLWDGYAYRTGVFPCPKPKPKTKKGDAEDD